MGVNKSLVRRSLIHIFATSVLTLFLVEPSWAQSQSDNGSSNEELQEIIVTGTRIKRSAEFDLPVPAQSLDALDLEIIGANQLGEAIADLPSITPDITSETSQSSTQGSGQSTISLRNLGSTRTLTLIDGRRTVGNTSTGSTISLDTIPDAFVERIEVITGGTSAVYGSDAVTGVVNIITRENFNDFTIETRLGTSDEGGNNEYGLELAAGANFDQGRGNVMFAFEWDKEEALYEHQRSLAMIDKEVDVNRNDDPDEIDLNRSSSIPGGLFAGNDGSLADPDYDSSYWYYATNGNADLSADFSTSRHGFNALGPETLSIPRERFLVAGKMHYDLNDYAQFFMSAHYSTSYTKSERAADTANSSRLGAGFPIYLNDGITPHPYVPQEIFDDAVETGRDSVVFRRRWTEMGNRFRESDNDTLRLWTGIKGAFLDTWTYEASVGYGEWRRAQSRVGDLVIPNYQQAIDVEYVDPGNPAMGIQCANSFSRSSGCVPLNVFGDGSVSPEQVNWLILRDQLRAMNRTTTASVWATGDAFQLPAGPLGVAVGFDYRKEQSQTRWDPISTSGGGTVTQQVNQDGEQDVNEFFLEAIVPVLADLPGIELLTVESAIRSSNYSTIGSVTSYKYGLTWQPISDVRFRASFAQANRAPNNIELFSRGLGSQGSLNDPCDDVTASSVGPFDDTCRQDAVIAGVIAADGVFENEGLQVQQPTVGNVGLKEETADTLTVGFVFTPRMMEGLSLALDYYDIEIKDAISEIDASDILEICYSSGDFAGTASCGIPIRNAATGQLEEVTETSLNVNSLRTSGFDLTARYQFEPSVSSLPGLSRIPGDVNLGLTVTRVDELEEEAPIPGTTDTFIENDLGLLGSPKYRTRFSARWSNGPWRVSWRTSYMGEMLNDDTGRRRLEACQEFSNCDQKIALFLDGEYTHNLRLSYSFKGVLGAESVRLFGGINNLTDNQGPILYGRNRPGAVGENSNSRYDVTGRYFYVGAKMRF